MHSQPGGKAFSSVDRRTLLSNFFLSVINVLNTLIVNLDSMADTALPINAMFWRISDRVMRSALLFYTGVTVVGDAYHLQLSIRVQQP
jgi:hypothetical protein